MLLDIMLPEEDGLQILKKLRAAPETRRLPVILLTAKNSEFDRVIGLDNGADDFISKPFSMLELIARIRAVLRRSQPRTVRARVPARSALRLPRAAHCAGRRAGRNAHQQGV